MSYEEDQNQQQEQPQQNDSSVIQDSVNQVQSGYENAKQAKRFGKNLNKKLTSQVPKQGARSAGLAARGAASSAISQGGAAVGGAAGTAAGGAGTVGGGVVAAGGTVAAAPAIIIGIVVFLILFLIIFIVVIMGGGNQGGAEVGGSICTGTCQTTCSGTDIPNTNAVCENNTSGQTQVCCVAPPAPGEQPPIHFYCQYDNKWETTTCKINQYGCTPTSVAMVLSSYGDTRWNPLNTALTNGGEGCAGGSSASDFIPWVKTLGYTVGPNLASRDNFNTTLARSYVSQGYIILAGANIRFNRSLSSSGGHAFVISNVSDEGVAVAFDPTFCSSDTSYTPRMFSVTGFGDPLLCDGKGCYWYWAYPIKKL